VLCRQLIVLYFSNNINKKDLFSLDLIPQGDQFFAIWMNQLPAQFNGRLIHSDEGASSSFQNHDFQSIQYRASILSIEVLEKTLRNSPHSNLFERKRASNSIVTNTKSPCSYNDKFIFFTNCLPINNLEQIPFNITTDIKRGTRANLPNRRGSPYREDLSAFERYNTANAVDNDSETCWKTNRPIQNGDYYGIDFETIQTNGDLSFSIEYLHGNSLQEKLQISISLDSQTWISISEEDQTGIIYDKEKKLVTFNTRLFPNGFQIFRFIKFTSLADDINSFHVCEVKLIN